MRSLLTLATILTISSITANVMDSSLHEDLEAINFNPDISAPPQFTLYMLPNSPSDFGARCLDGSPVGFYFQPGSGTDAYNWMIYFRKLVSY